MSNASSTQATPKTPIAPIAPIEPVMQSAEHVFSTMLQLPVDFGEPHAADAGAGPFALAVHVGAGVGSAVFGFDRSTAERIVALMTGCELASDSPELADALCELVGMICGGAAARAPHGGALAALPVVFLDAVPQGEVPVVSLPCATDCGSFVIEIACAERIGACAGETAGRIGIR